jgi:acyl carrier protein
MNDASDTLAALSPAARDAHAHWSARRDSASLDIAVRELIEHHRPTRARAASGPVSLSADSRLVADLGYDSLLLAELALLVEDLFGVEITTADLRGIVTVADLEGHLHARLSAPA